ncbi:hypothetical protein B9Z19DRAFT_1093318, partial [Tuber borchii]
MTSAGSVSTRMHWRWVYTGIIARMCRSWAATIGVWRFSVFFFFLQFRNAGTRSGCMIHGGSLWNWSLVQRLVYFFWYILKVVIDSSRA